MGSSTPSKIEAAAIETISAVTNAADYRLFGFKRGVGPR